jgi:hypothetical protein
MTDEHRAKLERVKFILETKGGKLNPTEVLWIKDINKQLKE